MDKQCSSWITCVVGNKHKAKCTVCDKQFSIAKGGFSDVKQHSRGIKHWKNLQCSPSNMFKVSQQIPIRQSPPAPPQPVPQVVKAPPPQPPPTLQPAPPPQPPPPPPEVCLRWNSYHSNMQAVFPHLLNNEQFVDVTLACEGRSIKCHKVMLSACSTYFDELLSQNPCQHPIVLMKDLRFWEVEALVDFMYRGEVNVSQDKLPSLLAAAEALQIKGLAGPASSSQDDSTHGGSNRDSPPPVNMMDDIEEPVLRRRKRRSFLTPSATVTSSPLSSSSGPMARPVSRLRPSPPVPGSGYRSPETHTELPKRRREAPIVHIEAIKTEPIDIDDSNESSEPATTLELVKTLDEMGPPSGPGDGGGGSSNGSKGGNISGTTGSKQGQDSMASGYESSVGRGHDIEPVSSDIKQFQAFQQEGSSSDADASHIFPDDDVNPDEEEDTKTIVGTM